LLGFVVIVAGAFGDNHVFVVRGEFVGDGEGGDCCQQKATDYDFEHWIVNRYSSVFFEFIITV
jgi:hypothetical protein